MEQQLEGIITKFAEIALTSKSVKEARVAFTIAERAHKMLIANRAELAQAAKAPTDFTALFISRIDKKIRRAQLYEVYVKYCSSNKFEPDKKSDFYVKLRLYGFKLSKLSGNYYIFPPDSMPDRLKLDAEI